MDDDQQFCLRWNNHQSTLISVFDTLLENETLVDCTLAAEGKFLKAHKVVLSACSPYFATLLQEQYDKHPIFILKDVKYQELRAMMDYMYRGEVNISQDQLAALLKAAESLQIKGLSDNRTSAGNSGNTIPKIDTSSHQAQQQQQQHRNLNVPLVGKISGGYTLEQTKRQRLGPSTLDAATELSGSREGSSSPSRRRRKVRRRSIENTVMSDVHHDNSNSSQQQTNSIVGAPTSGLSGVSAITAAASALAAAQLPAGALAAAAAVAAAAAATGSSSSNVVAGSNLTANVSATSANVTKKTEGNIKSVSGVTTAPNTSSNNNNNDAMTTENLTAAGGSTIMSTDDQEHQHHLNKADKQPQQPQQHHNNNNKQQHKIGAKDTSDLVVEPKSEYDDEGNEETVEDLTLDDEDMGMDDLDHNAGTSQGGAEGSNQGYVPWQHDRSQDELLLATQEAQQRDPQGIMGKYDFEASLVLGKGEVNTSGERFPCAVCGKSYLRKRHLQRHMRDECIGIPPRFSCELCPSRFRRKYHMVRHLTSKHSIPPAIAQQATGGGTRTSMASTSATNSASNMTNNNINYNGAINNLSMLKSHDSSAYESDSGGCMGVENLSLRRDAFENNNGVGHKNSGGSHVSAASPAHSGGACSSSGTHSPLPTAHIPITYGLSGAITAITSAYSGAPSETVHDAMTIEAATTENSTNIKSIKSEPMSPDSKSTTTDTAALAAAAAATVDDVVGKMDDDWKMKLSLQLISNSLLKERLMNTIPFGSGYNNSN